MIPGLPVPGMPAGGGFSFSDSGPMVSGDIHGRNQNGGAINFGGGWESALPYLIMAAAAVAVAYVIKKK